MEGKWPWIAHLSVLLKNGSTFQCSGVLISDNHVLTAAHCFLPLGYIIEIQSNYLSEIGKKFCCLFRLGPGYNVEHQFHSVAVTLGLYDKRSSQHAVQFGDSDFLTVSIHEKYNNATSENDLALVKFDRKVEFNDYIRPICLPPSSSSIENQQQGGPFNISSLNGKEAYIAGD